MRWLILCVIFVAQMVHAELARPPTPVFLRTVLVTGSGATPALAQQAAREQAWSQTQASRWANTAIVNTVVVTLKPTAQGYQSQMWVTIESVH